MKLSTLLLPALLISMCATGCNDHVITVETGATIFWTYDGCDDFGEKLTVELTREGEDEPWITNTFLSPEDFGNFLSHKDVEYTITVRDSTGRAVGRLTGVRGQAWVDDESNRFLSVPCL